LQATQKGIIGITVASHWFLPYSNSTQDKAAAQRSLDFLYGWYVLRLFSLDLSLPRFIAHSSVEVTTQWLWEEREEFITS